MSCTDVVDSTSGLVVYMKAFLGRDTITILKADLANPVKYVQVLVFTIIAAMPLGAFRRT